MTTRICAGVVAFNGVKLNHPGAGVPGEPPSTSKAKSMGELLTDVTVTACVGKGVPFAIPLNVKLGLESCTGLCATAGTAKPKAPPTRMKRRRRSPYVIGH